MIAHEVLIVAPFERSDERLLGKLGAQHLLEAKAPLGMVTHQHRAADHRDPASAAAAETSKKAARGAAGLDVVNADETLLFGAWKVRHQRDDGDAAGSQLAHGDAHDGGVSRHHGDPVHGLGIEAAQHLSQSARVEGWDLSRLDDREVAQDRRGLFRDVFLERVHEAVLPVRQDEAEPIASLAREIGGGEVAFEPKAADRVEDAVAGFLAHAVAVVQNPVDGREADARNPGNVVNCRAGHRVFASPVWRAIEGTYVIF